jgi:hypothetical protein
MPDAAYYTYFNLTTDRIYNRIRFALLIEGRFLETILKAERGVASRGAARNRMFGRHGNPPARH